MQCNANDTKLSVKIDVNEMRFEVEVRIAYAKNFRSEVDKIVSLHYYRHPLSLVFSAKVGNWSNRAIEGVFCEGQQGGVERPVVEMLPSRWGLSTSKLFIAYVLVVLVSAGNPLLTQTSRQ